MSEYPTERNVLGYFNRNGVLVYKSNHGYYWNGQQFDTLELLDAKLSEINQVIGRSIINPKGKTVTNRNDNFVALNSDIK